MRAYAGIAPAAYGSGGVPDDVEEGGAEGEGRPQHERGDAHGNTQSGGARAVQEGSEQGRGDPPHDAEPVGDCEGQPEWQTTPEALPVGANRFGDELADRAPLGGERRRQLSHRGP